MSRVIHFEVPIDDPERAVSFYRNVFGWQINKFEGPVDYWLVTTGEQKEPGIDGALTLRSGGMPNTVNTVGVPSLDEAVARIEANGGKIVLPRMAVTGVGWLAYGLDTENNIFGVLQMDETAA